MRAFDYIIVGGGSAGCVLAARLSERPDLRVLLLEAGGRPRGPLYDWPAGFARMTKGAASWGYQTVPQRHLKGRVLWYTQARVLGGGSSINAQIYTRGNPADYDGWVEGNAVRGWSYAEVLPYFRRAEDNEVFEDAFHSRGGPLGVSRPRAALPVCEAFIRAAGELGIPFNPDFNGAVQAGAGFYQLTQRNVRRSSTASAYLDPARGRANLTVLSGVTVRRIVVEGGRARGVEIARGGRPEMLAAEAEVIVAAGAIGSPALLMRSGLGPADHLRAAGIAVAADLPGVGQNLQDHLDLCALADLTGPHSYDRIKRPDRTLAAGLQYLLFRSGPVASSLFETGAFWFADPAAAAPDLQFHLGQGSGIEKGIAEIDGCGITLNSALLRPDSRGTVRLDPANPLGAPLIDPNYFAEARDRELSLRGLEIAREILRQPALRPFVRSEVLPGPAVTSTEALFDYACRMAKTDHHPVGTCRMGEGPEAVVSDRLAVHGVAGLRVCDASVMPRIPSCNTNAPTIMIAEKASDLILGRAALAPAVLAQPEPAA